MNNRAVAKDRFGKTHTKETLRISRMARCRIQLLLRNDELSKEQRGRYWCASTIQIVRPPKNRDNKLARG